MVNAIASVLAFTVFVASTLMGVDWLTIGYGLNPWIAFPIAAIALYNSWVQMSIAVWEHRNNQLEELVESFNRDMQARMNENKSVTFD